jgi:hypothetical protein
LALRFDSLVRPILNAVTAARHAEKLIVHRKPPIAKVAIHTMYLLFGSDHRKVVGALFA